MTKKDRRRHTRRREDLHPAPRHAEEAVHVGPKHRFISRDGRVNIKKHGLSRKQPVDWYHMLLNISWVRLFAGAGFFFFAINALFGLLYMIDVGGVTHTAPYSFWDNFFFSVHVFSTLGFNQLNPASFYSNVLVSVESFFGWCAFGLLTGLLFSRFSRPSARVMFSHYASISPFEGVPTLIFRAANRRGNQILQAQIHVSLSRNEKTLEGESVRRVYDLKLLRSTSSFFNLTWTIRHPIDTNSPLFGETHETLRESETEIVVLLSGVDDTFGQTVHGRFAYNQEEIIFGYRFASMFGRDPEGHPIIDFSRFDEIEPIDGNENL